MAFEKGNEHEFKAGNSFWKFATNPGRPKKFETPDDLWIRACEYFQWCEENPLIEVDFRGKDAKRIQVPKMRAYTWEGLELYLDVYSLRDYKTNPNYSEYSQVVARIEKIIYTQKFTGAAAGMLNPSIIARDLGLVDKTDQTTGGEKTNSIKVKIVRPEEVDE